MRTEPETSAKETPPANDFVRHAEETPVGFFREFYDFLRDNKKWWLLPIIVWLLILSGFVIFSGTALPFIYSIF